MSTGIIAVALILSAILLVLVALSDSFVRSNPSPWSCKNKRPSRRSSRRGRPLESVVAYYRTRDGEEDYRFRFVQIRKNQFRIYILEAPSNLGHQPHRLWDSAGAYICWSVPITSYSDAKRIAAQWAEAVEQFNSTGEKF